MKTLIFSDSHITHEFDEKKFRFLKTIINDADKVIINGDFWDSDYLTFEQFISSPWKHLFPYLKSKNTVYLYGNHDKKEDTTKDVSLFSDLQTKRYEIPVGTKKAIIEHGDRLMPFGNWKKIPRINAISEFLNSVEKFLAFHNKKIMHLTIGRYNRQIKEKLKDELKKNEVFVCGHTHVAEFDEVNGFINSGIVKHGIGQYLLLEKNTITPREEYYL
jgi:predicted phosphodiesterase